MSHLTTMHCAETVLAFISVHDKTLPCPKPFIQKCSFIKVYIAEAYE
jgi:hypothetical protein